LIEIHGALNSFYQPGTAGLRHGDGRG